MRAQTDTTEVINKEHDLHELTVTASQGVRRMGGPVNGVLIGQQELFKAACCNLGESFTTNPSVDVSYNDATTGARQIKLLGLSGTYVQMLTEQMPNFRGAALPYALDYVPGPWMQSIQVSKGASTVKNGYESMTGQIDIEYKKPNDTEQINANLYADVMSRYEGNFDANLHMNDKLSTLLMGHYENSSGHHDANDDNFMDRPNRQQWNLQNRWKYVGDKWIFHAGASLLKETREGGQIHLPASDGHSSHLPLSTTPRLYRIHTETHRYEGYMKNALVLNQEHQTNIALMLSGSIHQLDATYDQHPLSLDEKNGYAQLMLETQLTPEHQLSVGTSLNHDHFEQDETTTGAYAQYTYNLNNRLTVMAGLRADYSSRYHWFVTPRLHLKATPADWLTLRLSAGKGYRTPHALAETHYLLASHRTLTIDALQQEAAWNYGLSAAFNIPIGEQTLKLNTEYYYTDFERQMVIDYESDASLIRVTNLDGDSYSHTFQIDATYPLLESLTLTAAYRYNNVKTTLAGRLMEKPLTSRYKGLVSASFKPGMGIWQFDATVQFNGGGRIVGEERFGAYEQLQAQITRDFRHFSVYVGGENLTNKRQKDPVRGAAQPWGPDFDATLVWGPVEGRIFYAGMRFNLERM